ncbi:MAG: RNA polymerase sigma-70 factor [Bacteroidales bacterium]|nr:RNA polymerase sigma-70 factor [Bacteroidales bacterium]
MNKYAGGEVVVGLKNGDENAYDAVYRRYYTGLCAFASQYVPASDCEEIVPDVMMWLWENRDGIAVEMSLKSLLFMMVKNKCLNSIAHRAVKQRVHETLYRKFVAQFEDPDFCISGELMKRVDTAVKKLPEDYRKVFEMNRFDDKTYRVIAEELGVSEKTVACRISQSLKILRADIKGLFTVFNVAAVFLTR